MDQKLAFLALFFILLFGMSSSYASDWNFGPGSFLVGKTYSPLNMLYSNQVWWNDTNLLDFGGLLLLLPD